MPTVAVINKTDLPSQLDISKITNSIDKIVYISAATGEGKDELISAIAQLAGTAELNPSEGILSYERQRADASAALNAVREAKAALKSGMTYDAVTVTVEDAITALLEMTGEKTGDEVIDRVFHTFCVGK